jgi:hypothetical protein
MIKRYSPQKGHRDEINCTINYKQKRRKGKTYNKSIPLNRNISPNCQVDLTAHSKIVINDSDKMGEIEIRLEIPCFREEIDEVYNHGMKILRDFMNKEINRLRYKPFRDKIY